MKVSKEHKEWDPFLKKVEVVGKEGESEIREYEYSFSIGQVSLSVTFESVVHFHQLKNSSSSSYVIHYHSPLKEGENKEKTSAKVQGRGVEGGVEGGGGRVEGGGGVELRVKLEESGLMSVPLNNGSLLTFVLHFSPLSPLPPSLLSLSHAVWVDLLLTFFHSLPSSHHPQHSQHSQNIPHSSPFDLQSNFHPRFSRLSFPSFSFSQHQLPRREESASSSNSQTTGNFNLPNAQVKFENDKKVVFVPNPNPNLPLSNPNPNLPLSNPNLGRASFTHFLGFANSPLNSFEYKRRSSNFMSFGDLSYLYNLRSNERLDPFQSSHNSLFLNNSNTSLQLSNNHNNDNNNNSNNNNNTGSSSNSLLLPSSTNDKESSNTKPSVDTSTETNSQKNINHNPPNTPNLIKNTPTLQEATKSTFMRAPTSLTKVGMEKKEEQFKRESREKQFKSREEQFKSREQFKSGEQYKRESREEQFRRHFEEYPFSVWLIDGEQKLIDFNPSSLSIFGENLLKVRGEKEAVRKLEKLGEGGGKGGGENWLEKPLWENGVECLSRSSFPYFKLLKLLPSSSNLTLFEVIVSPLFPPTVPPTFSPTPNLPSGEGERGKGGRKGGEKGRGEETWYVVEYRPLMSKGGNSEKSGVSLLGCSIEVSWFQSLFSFSPIETILITPDGTITNSNIAFARLFKKQPNQVLLENLFDSVLVKDHKKLTNAIQRMVEQSSTLVKPSNENSNGMFGPKFNFNQVVSVTFKKFMAVGSSNPLRSMILSSVITRDDPSYSLHSILVQFLSKELFHLLPNNGNNNTSNNNNSNSSSSSSTSNPKLPKKTDQGSSTQSEEFQVEKNTPKKKRQKKAEETRKKEKAKPSKKQKILSHTSK